MSGQQGEGGNALLNSVLQLVNNPRTGGCPDSFSLSSVAIDFRRNVDVRQSISITHFVTVPVAQAHCLPRASSKALYSSAFHMS